MNKNKKLKLFIGVLYSLITVMLVLLGYIYKICYLGAAISAFVACNAFQGDKVSIKFAKIKEGAKIRKTARDGRHI